MPTEAKREAVQELAELLRGSSALAVADYRGLTVAEMHTVRRSLRANGVSLKIAKNRLLKIAADEAGLADLKLMLEGPTAIASTTGDEVSLARALQDAFRPHKFVTLRGGLLAGQPVSASDLQRLATLPSREVLLGRLAGGMVAPLAGMAGVLAANLRNLVGVLNAVAEQKRQAEATPAVIEPAVVPAEAPSAEAGPAAEAEPLIEAAETAESSGTETAPIESADIAAAEGAPEAEAVEGEAREAAGTETAESADSGGAEVVAEAEPAEAAETGAAEAPTDAAQISEAEAADTETAEGERSDVEATEADATDTD